MAGCRHWVRRWGRSVGLPVKQPSHVYSATATLQRQTGEPVGVLEGSSRPQVLGTCTRNGVKTSTLDMSGYARQDAGFGGCVGYR